MSTDTETAAPGPPIPGQDWAALKDYLAGQVESDLAVSMSFREMGDEFTAAVHGALVSANRGTLAKMRELEGEGIVSAGYQMTGPIWGTGTMVPEIGHDGPDVVILVGKHRITLTPEKREEWRRLFMEAERHAEAHQAVSG